MQLDDITISRAITRSFIEDFEKAMDIVHDLIALSRINPNINVVVNTTVTEHNIDDVPELQSHLEDVLGADRPPHNLLYDQRLGHNLLSDPQTRAKIEVIEETARRAAAQRSSLTERLIERYYVGAVNAVVLRQLAARKMIYRCNAGRKLIVVLPDGRVSPCEPFIFEDRYAHLPTFNLRDYDLDYPKVLADPRFEPLLATIDSCMCAPCPWTCSALSSLLYSPRNWPLLFRRHGRVT